MSRKMNKIAQSTAEYAILIAIVVGAVVAMQVYVRRGIQGRIADVVDYTGVNNTTILGGAQSINMTAEQYEPYYMVSQAATDQAQKARTVVENGTVQAGSKQATRQVRQQVVGWNTTEAPTGMDKSNATLSTTDKQDVLDF